MVKTLFVLPTDKNAITLYSEPLGIMCLSAVVKRLGCLTAAVPANWRDLRAQVAAFQPDVLAFTATTGAHLTYEALAARVKREYPRLITIVGGPHPTYFPQMIEKEGIDVICRGEGELAFEEFVTRVEAGADFSDVQNLWVKLPDGRVRQNPLRPEIRDLDTIPFPDRELCARYYRRDVRWLITTRGCPFDCSYCFNHAYRKLYAGTGGKAVRYRSPANVIAELKTLLPLRPQPALFYFVDDTFDINRRWLLELLAAYKAEIGKPFFCIVRIDLMTEELARALAGAGCARVSVGIEAGNEAVRARILRRPMSDQAILDGCRYIREAGMRMRALNILGIPPGDFETDWETLELNLRCRPSHASATLLTPFPMTELGDWVREQGYWYDPDFGTFSRNQARERSVLRLRDKVAIEILHRLFPYVVRWPFLKQPVRWLCRQAGAFPRLADGFLALRKPYRQFILWLYGLYARLVRRGGY